jgi:Ca2+-binding RTX toxin-like protein
MIKDIVAQAFDDMRDGATRALANHALHAETSQAKATAGPATEDPGAPHLIVGSAGHDELIGGPNADVLVAGKSTHTMTGMGGADTFVIGTKHVSTTITDFTPGVDKLAFTTSGKPDHAEVHVWQENGDAVVRVGYNQVVLTNVDPHQLHPHDLVNLLV